VTGIIFAWENPWRRAEVWIEVPGCRCSPEQQEGAGSVLREGLSSQYSFAKYFLNSDPLVVLAFIEVKEIYRLLSGEGPVDRFSTPSIHRRRAA
jgi:hypothetical protein